MKIYQNSMPRLMSRVNIYVHHKSIQEEKGSKFHVESLQLALFKNGPP